MQDFYATIQQTYNQNNGKTPVFLRPEQIRSKKPLRSNRSTNTVIRLSESIKRYGIITPLLVQKSGEECGLPVYELVDGEQRLRAAMLAGLTKIPCLPLQQDDKSYAIAGIIEHMRNGRLNMFEQAAGFRLLMQDFSLTQEEIARNLGTSQSTIANKLRLLKLSHEEQRLILEYGLTERHARSILRLREPQIRNLALRRIQEKSLNVAQTEELTEKLLSESPKNDKSIANFPTNLQKSPDILTTISPQTPPSGCVPRKFAIPDLTPLYNSIERTLSIFRKTGASASCMREECTDMVRITIEIPKKA